MEEERPPYPETLMVPSANKRTVRYVKESKAKDVAELGIYEGHTATEIAKLLPKEGSLWLFDYQPRVDEVVAKISPSAQCTVRGMGNSCKLRDSYCWSLMEILKEHREPIWDYVYLDGPHTWAIDGFAFFLCDRLLRPGGYLDLDDYTWTLAASPSLNPKVFPQTALEYTDAQIAAKQIELVCDLLVRRSGYREIARNKLFRKAI